MVFGTAGVAEGGKFQLDISHLLRAWHESVGPLSGVPVRT